MATKAEAEKAEAARQKQEGLVNAAGRTTSGRPGGVWSRFRRFFGGRRDGKGKLVEKPSVTLLNLHTETGWNQTLKEWAEWPAAQRTATQAVVSGLMVEAAVELSGVVRTVGGEVMGLLEEVLEEKKKQTALLEEQTAALRAMTARRGTQVIEAAEQGGDSDSDDDSDDDSDGDGDSDDDSGNDDGEGEADEDEADEDGEGEAEEDEEGE